MPRSEQHGVDLYTYILIEGRLQVVKPSKNDPDAIVPGLLAAGEAACASVHGANRLGANSLLDIVVFGRACANTVRETIEPGEAHAPLPAGAGDDTVARMDKMRMASGDVSAASLRKKMQKVMQSDAAVFRTQVRMLQFLMLHDCCICQAYVLFG